MTTYDHILKLSLKKLQNRYNRALMSVNCNLIC